MGDLTEFSDNQDMSAVDPSPILDLIHAFRRSKTMFTAASLGIFDHLHDAPSTADGLAQRLGCHPESLARLLDACVGLGLIQLSGNLYSNAEISEVYLRTGSPETLAGYILYSNDVLYPLWQHLGDAVRHNSPRWNQEFGWDGPIFDHFFRTPEARRTFLNGMHGFGRLSSPEVVRVFNLNRFRHLVDLGGATGHLAIAACERYGNLQATVFDLPAAVEQALPHIQNSRAAARLKIQAGDFFSDPLPPADLYAVGRILHDWSEDKIHRLLAKIHAALPPGGGLLIAEALLDEDHSGPVPAQMQSLNMLVITEGKERSASEYRALLEPAGFTNVEARRTGAPLDAVLAIRKE
jgi:acetylserotonin N-methyltransferase